jgi:DNA-directed RNA polymerase specialized sigma24 family protein
MEDLDVHAAAIAAGDADAFARFLRGGEPALRASLRRFAARVDTEAVLQEALLRLWQGAAHFASDGRPNGLLRLAARIARNLAIDAARRQQGAPLEAGDDPVVEPQPPDPLLRRAIARCRDRLPEKPALALSVRLDAAGAEPDATLAARLHMTPNTFLQNFTRARRFLADCLRKAGVDAELIAGVEA